MSGPFSPWVTQLALLLFAALSGPDNDRLRVGQVRSVVTRFGSRLGGALLYVTAGERESSVALTPALYRFVILVQEVCPAWPVVFRWGTCSGADARLAERCVAHGRVLDAARRYSS